MDNTESSINKKEIPDNVNIYNFVERIDKDKDTGCWNWSGHIDFYGYGIFFIEGHSCFKAHGVSYLIFKKRPSLFMVIDHICKNRRCVNPNHLREVSERENVLINSDSAAAKNKIKTKCKYGHLFIGKNTRFDKKGKRICVECMKMYNKKARDKRSEKQLINKEKE